jgi:hypothetical protein
MLRCFIHTACLRNNNMFRPFFRPSSGWSYIAYGAGSYTTCNVKPFGLIFLIVLTDCILYWHTAYCIDTLHVVLTHCILYWHIAYCIDTLHVVLTHCILYWHSAYCIDTLHIVLTHCILYWHTAYCIDTLHIVLTHHNCVIINYTVVTDYWYIDINIDIFVNCNWVGTRWQYTFTHKQYIEHHN